MTDSKIKFQVEGLQSIKTEMAAILKDVTSQTELINKSNKDFVSSLKEQIQLLKERNKIGSQFIAGSLSPQTPDPTLSLTLKDLNESLNKLVEQLREDTTEQTSTPSTGPQQIPTSQGISPKMVQSFAMSSLLNPLSSRDPFDAGFGVASNIGSSMMLQGGKAGWAGLAVTLGTALGKVQYDILKELEPQMARMARMQGGRTSSYLDSYNEFARFGFNRSQVLGSRAGLLGTTGIDNERDLLSLISLQTGFNIGEEQLTNFSRLGRGDKGFDLMSNFSTFYSGLVSSGLTQGQTDALIPEYLRLLTEIGQEQLSTLGKVDVGINSKLITALSGEERMQTPEAIRKVVSGLTGGLTSAATPQLEALQFQSLTQAFPGKTLWELEKIRSAPFESGNEGYLKSVLQNLEQVTSTRDDFERGVGTMFGVNPLFAETIANAFYKGNLDLLREQQSGISEQDVYDRAIDAVDRFKTATATFEEIKIGEITVAINDGFDKLIQFLSNSQATTKALKTYSDASGLGPVHSAIFALVAPHLNKIIK